VIRLPLSIVIVNWNTKDLLLDCLASVFATVKELSFEVILVDNASTDGSVVAVRCQYPLVRVIQNDRNLGFAAANNRAFSVMRGHYALLLNTDTILTDGAVASLFCHMEENKQVAMACGQLLNQDSSRQNSIANFPSFLGLLVNESLLRRIFPHRFPGKNREYHQPFEVESCIGACLMARKEAMDQVGLLDESYFFFFEETDWAWRMRQAGWKSVFVPQARIYHLQGQSAGNNVKSRIMFYRSRYIFLRRWHSRGFHLFVIIVSARLFVDLILNAVASVATLGLNKRFRGKAATYARLAWWHICGCP